MKAERNQFIEKKISLGQLIIALSIVITGILIFKGCTIVAEDIKDAVSGLGGYLRYLPFMT